MSINRVVLVGNLTRDPELRDLPSGTSVCHLRVACNRLRRTEGGTWEEKPNYFDVTVFGNQAANVHRYLRKGRPVGIDGRLEWREWESADQQKRQSVNIVADTIQFLGSPDGGRREEGEPQELAGVAAAAIDESDDELGF
jgi:single-strand DNA-binding protein